MLKVDQKTEEVIVRGSRIMLLAEYAVITEVLCETFSGNASKEEARKDLEIAFEAGLKSNDEIKAEIDKIPEPMKAILDSITDQVLRGGEKVDV